MGAFIANLHRARGIDNYFVLAPNLPIYDELIADFTPNTPKFVFTGTAELATIRPEIITGDPYGRAMEDAIVLAKRDAAEIGCGRAADHSNHTGGKKWRYALIPDDLLTENRTLEALDGMGACAARRWTRRRVSTRASEPRTPRSEAGPPSKAFGRLLARPV